MNTVSHYRRNARGRALERRLFKESDQQNDHRILSNVSQGFQPRVLIVIEFNNSLNTGGL